VVYLAVVLFAVNFVSCVPSTNDGVSISSYPVSRVKCLEIYTRRTTVRKSIAIMDDVLALYVAVAFLQPRAGSSFTHGGTVLAAIAVGYTDLAGADLDSFTTGLTACRPQTKFSHLTINRTRVDVASLGL
jgi:hypothetical protein